MQSRCNCTYKFFNLGNAAYFMHESAGTVITYCRDVRDMRVSFTVLHGSFLVISKPKDLETSSYNGIKDYGGLYCEICERLALSTVELANICFIIKYSNNLEEDFKAFCSQKLATKQE